MVNMMFKERFLNIVLVKLDCKGYRFRDRIGVNN